MVLSGTVPQLTTSTYRRYSLVWTTQDVENHKPIRNMIYIKKKWWVFPHLGTHRQEDHLSTKCGDVVGKWYQKYARRWGHHPVWMVENNRHMEVSWNGGTPSYHPFIDGISPYKLSIWGYPHLWKPPNDSAQLQFLPAIKCTSTFQLGNISELQGLENRLLSQCLCKGSHQAHLRIAQRVQRLLPETMGFTWLHYITSPSWGLDPAGTSLISIHTQPGSVKLIWWFPES